MLLALAAPAAGATRQSVPMPPGAWHVERVSPYAMPGWAATDVDAGIIYAPHGLTSFEEAHEIGHLLDYRDLADRDRSFFRRIMHAPAGAWWRPSGAAEWFADYYAAAATGIDVRHGDPAGYATLTYDRLTRFRLALFGLAVRDELAVGTISQAQSGAAGSGQAAP